MREGGKMPAPGTGGEGDRRRQAAAARVKRLARDAGLGFLEIGEQLRAAFQ